MQSFAKLGDCHRCSTALNDEVDVVGEDLRGHRKPCDPSKGVGRTEWYSNIGILVIAARSRPV